jgi:hypothetical protein
MYVKKLYPGCEMDPHRFFIKRKQTPRTLAHAREGQALRRAQRGVFFSPSSLKFASDEIRTQDLLGARRYRAGLAISTARPFAGSMYVTSIARFLTR